MGDAVVDESIPCDCGCSKADLCGVFFGDVRIHPPFTGFPTCVYGIDLIRVSPVVPEDCRCLAFRGVACKETLIRMRDLLLMYFPLPVAVEAELEEATEGDGAG